MIGCRNALIEELAIIIIAASMVIALIGGAVISLSKAAKSIQADEQSAYAVSENLSHEEAQNLSEAIEKLLMK